jgi:hypothetical protein
MALLSIELLKKKLNTWVLSSKTPEVLGFEETQAKEVKQELEALVEMGLVERHGERRGLKYRLVDASRSNEDEQVDADDDGAETLEEDAPVKLDNAASLRAFFANKEHIKAGTEGKTPLQLMSAITDLSIKDPSVLSHTLSYKRTSENNIIVTFWMGCAKQYEKEYTLSAFSKVLTSELKALSKPATA